MTIIVSAKMHRFALRLDDDPQVAGARVPGGVGGDLLHAAKQHMRRLWIENAQLANDIEVYLRQRHHADQIAESLGHGHSTSGVRLGDDIAHIAEQLASQTLAKLQPWLLHA